MESKLEVKLALDEEEIKPGGEAIFTIVYDNNGYDSRLTHTSLYGTIFPPTDERKHQADQEFGELFFPNNASACLQMS